MSASETAWGLCGTSSIDFRTNFQLAVWEGSFMRKHFRVPPFLHLTVPAGGESANASPESQHGSPKVL